MTLLNLLDWGHLRQYGLATDVNLDGYVKIHRRLLTDKPYLECADTPLAPLHSIRTCYQSRFFERIPAWLLSRATLEFIGFSEFHADKIWDAWLDAPESYYCPTGKAFLVWIMNGLLFPEHFTWRTRDNVWRQIHMQAYGLSEETQQEIHEQTCDPNHTSSCSLTHSSYSSPPLTRCMAVLEEKLISRFMYLERAHHLSIHRANIRYYFGAEIAEPTFPDVRHDARAYPANSVFSRCFAYAEAAKISRMRIARQKEAQKKKSVLKKKDLLQRKFAQKRIAWKKKVAPMKKHIQERTNALKYALKRKFSMVGSDDRRSRKKACKMGRLGFRVAFLWSLDRRGG
ncbi:hypothetical protein E4U19_006596 [Claviceps sp. Clav32 group G5]|nr:hypothetical protein E4U19_006596 [Claviceps sp. Clav32 group G5]KAG6048834.1 hypothetical protein E4U39_006895 [Claviceps sp. Clav50 group G5]